MSSPITQGWSQRRIQTDREWSSPGNREFLSEQSHRDRKWEVHGQAHIIYEFHSDNPNNHKPQERTCSWEYILKWARTWHTDIFVLKFSLLVALRKGIRTRVLESQIFGLKKNLTLITFLVLGHLERLPVWLPTSCKANYIKHCGSCSWDLQQDEHRSPANPSQVPLRL